MAERAQYNCPHKLLQAGDEQTGRLKEKFQTDFVRHAYDYALFSQS